MPTVRTRQRQIALGRKGAYETSLLFEDEEHNTAPSQPLKLKEQPEPTSMPSSPVSVASFLDSAPGAQVPVEIKSLTLPGAWVVVGKGGRPVKNDKMYDEPLKAAKSKKKKKTRKVVETEPLLVTLENTGSSSKCLREFERSPSQRQKQMARAKEVKYWTAYQHAKQLRRDALGELVAALSLADGPDDVEAPPLETVPAPRETTRRDHKANSSKDKARRRARSAAAALRCELWHEDDEQAVPLDRAAADETPSPAVRLMSGELQHASGRRAAEPKPPGAWTTVGKRGKPVSEFPPLPPRETKAAEPKRLAEPTEADSKPSKQSKLARKTSHEGSGSKRDKGMKCSVM